VTLRQDTRFIWKIPDTADTTSGPSDCAYDRFVVDKEMDLNVVGDAAVFLFDAGRISSIVFLAV